MGKPLSPQQRQAWAEKIRSQQESGLSIQKWCDENAIASHVFHYWKGRLASSIIKRDSFTELVDPKGCSIKVTYKDVDIHIQSSSFKGCLQVLKELSC